MRKGHQVQPGEFGVPQPVEVDAPVAVDGQVDQLDAVTGSACGQHHRIGTELAGHHTDPATGGQGPGVDERREGGGGRVMEGHVVRGETRTQQLCQVRPGLRQRLAVTDLRDIPTDPAFLGEVLGVGGDRGPARPRTPGGVKVRDRGRLASRPPPGGKVGMGQGSPRRPQVGLPTRGSRIRRRGHPESLASQPLLRAVLHRSAAPGHGVRQGIRGSPCPGGPLCESVTKPLPYVYLCGWLGDDLAHYVLGDGQGSGRCR